MKIDTKIFLLLSLSGLFLSGCQSDHISNQVLSNQESQVKLRSMQTRVYDTTDTIKTMRSIISTLQDLGFVIEKADEALGAVTACKFVKHEDFRISVTARPKGTTQLMVRANAQYRARSVEDPQTYQDFFTTLSKAMFLTDHEVD
jgi:hypothetical protein